MSAGSQPMSVERVTQDCVELLDRIGQILAKAIVAKVSAFDMEPEQIDAHISTLMKDIRQMMLDDGVSENDAEVSCQQIYKALVSEGVKLTSLMQWEGGHA